MRVEVEVGACQRVVMDHISSTLAEIELDSFRVLIMIQLIEFSVVETDLG